MQHFVEKILGRPQGHYRQISERYETASCFLSTLKIIKYIDEMTKMNVEIKVKDKKSVMNFIQTNFIENISSYIYIYVCV